MQNIFNKISARHANSQIKELTSGSLIFQCNICGEKCISPFDKIARETPSCGNCGSTVRMRSIIHALSTELFNESIALPDFPVRPKIRVVGLSDWNGYAIPLAHKLNYTNSFYHKEPKLDITSPGAAWTETLDILISSDVFEHVEPPVSIAFENTYKLLKPGGKLILTVPYTLNQNTVEHFPNLYQYIIQKEDEKFVLHNKTKSGSEEIFDKLVFHGGDGATLEMRVFCLDGLKKEIEKAGFTNTKVLNEPFFKFGIYNKSLWSLPIVAQKPSL